MIVVKLQGGLGNQMFQYAAGFQLAKRLDTELKLDLSYLESDQPGTTRRRYELGRFNISASTASRKEVRRVNGLSIAGRFFERFSARPGPVQIRQKNCQLEPAFYEVEGDVYLDGYWQSEQYFADVREPLSEEFSIRNKPEGKNEELLGQIRSSNAVSVHIRRGDYVSNSKTALFHGTCSAAYYRAAMERIARDVRQPVFFMFSDEPQVLEGAFPTSAPCIVVDHNGPQCPIEDFRLMRACKHHIIANSSFSWWSAWLSSKPEKTVLMPRQWFRDDRIDTSNLVPDGWQSI